MSTARINKKRNQRIVIGFAILLVIIGAYVWFMQNKGHLRYGSTINTNGWIAAVEVTKDGSQVDLIKPDGTILVAPGSGGSLLDREPTWSPDGGILFFVSDRAKDEPQMFSWNPNENKVEQQTMDRRNKSGLHFDITEKDVAGLMTMGGTVVDFRPYEDERTKQILPPKTKGMVEQGGNGEITGAMDAAYAQLGTGFSKARWFKNKTMVVATMRTTQGGEVLITQEIGTNKPPAKVLSAEHIDFDIDEKNGRIVLAAVNIEPADAKLRDLTVLGQTAKHAVVVLDPTAGQLMRVAMFAGDDHSFWHPAFSPDGQSLILVDAPYKPKQPAPNALILCTPTENGESSGKALKVGQVLAAHWSNDGKYIAFVARENGKGDVYAVGSNGFGEKKITSGKNDFVDAVMSPAAPTS